MKKSAVLLCGVLAGISVEAANITWVSFHSDQNDLPNTAAAGAGFTLAPDAGYTQLLRDAGHNVTRMLRVDNLNNDPAAIATLNASDLVIISRSVPSGDFDATGEVQAWNGLSAPTMILGGYVIRDNRLGFAAGNDIPDTAGTIKLTINNPNHPIFSGIALDGSNVMVDNFATIQSHNSVAQRGISVVSGAMKGGTILATVNREGDPAVGGMVIGEFDAGTILSGDANAFTSTLGGDRLIFLTGSREDANPSDKAGIFDLTPAGAQMFLNAVDYMAVPEPTTYALLGLGAAALLFRRKKA